MTDGKAGQDQVPLYIYSYFSSCISDITVRNSSCDVEIVGYTLKLEESRVVEGCLKANEEVLGSFGFELLKIELGLRLAGCFV